MKASTKSRAPQTGLDLRGLFDAAGLKPVDVASRARISIATVYRAMAGGMPHTPQVLAIALVGGWTEEVVRAAIARGRKGAA